MIKCIRNYIVLLNLTSITKVLYHVKRSFTNGCKEKKVGLPTKNGEESSLVAGVVLFTAFGGSRVHEGVLYYQKPILASLVSVFLLPLAYMSKLLRQGNKKPGAFGTGFLVVDKRFELSNLDLIKDIDRIIELEEILSSTLSRFDQVITKPDHKYQVQNYDAPSHIIHQSF